MLRQLAYEEGCPTIPGPDVDPEGWRTLPTVPVAGTLFNSRQLEARCNIAIAKPVCVTSHLMPHPAHPTVFLGSSVTLEEASSRAL